MRWMEGGAMMVMMPVLIANDDGDVGNGDDASGRGGERKRSKVRLKRRRRENCCREARI